MLIFQNVTYIHPDRDRLFHQLQFTLHKGDKAALVGHNGVGKSILLNLAAGRLQPSEGRVKAASLPYLVPQQTDRFNGLSVARVLGIDAKLDALAEILDGRATEENLRLLDDDWTLEERCREALAHWDLEDLDWNRKLETLSGGQKTKVFLAGIAIGRPEIVLLDEPSNHLDMPGREKLYAYITDTAQTLLTVSHDRTLLNLVHTVYELGPHGMVTYGGNYDFYAEQKHLEETAFDREVKSREKALRKAKEIEREAVERRQKLDARGKKKQEKAGLPTISMNTFKNNAEKSTARTKDVHAEKVEGLARELAQARREQASTDRMKVDLDHSALHEGKKLFVAENLFFGYNRRALRDQPLNFTISSGERIALKGPNGSGKTTLLKLLPGKAEPLSGSLYRADIRAEYIDQDYSAIRGDLSVYEQARTYNRNGLEEHDIKIRLNRFLFGKETWNKPCHTLSGGEKMRLMLCCLQIGNRAPDLIILDEPTNNLDIRSCEILTESIKAYRGTLIVVSHDVHFLEEIDIQRSLEL